MGRPKKKRNDLDEATVPFELEEDYVPIYGKSTTRLVQSYTLPEWSKEISDALISEANLKGSPGFDPGYEQARQVEQMAALGASTSDISAILRIEPKLLEKYYSYELETAQSRINQRVAKIALQSALSGDTDMVKFWLSRRAGWKEIKTTEVTGANGGAIEFREVKQSMLDAIEAEITDITFEENKK